MESGSNEPWNRCGRVGFPFENILWMRLIQKVGWLLPKDSTPCNEHRCLLDFVISCHSAGCRCRCIGFDGIGKMNLWKRFITKCSQLWSKWIFQANFPLERAFPWFIASFLQIWKNFNSFSSTSGNFFCLLLINSFDCNCTKWRCCRDEFIMTEFIWWGKWGLWWIFREKWPVWSSGCTGDEVSWRF